MTKRKITVEAPNGLHARPVGELVRLVKNFPETKLTLSTPARTVSAGSMLSVLSLGLKRGTEVEIGAEGGDETAAAEAVAAFIASITE